MSAAWTWCKCSTRATAKRPRRSPTRASTPSSPCDSSPSTTLCCPIQWTRTQCSTPWRQVPTLSLLLRTRPVYLFRFLVGRRHLHVRALFGEQARLWRGRRKTLRPHLRVPFAIASVCSPGKFKLVTDICNCRIKVVHRDHFKPSDRHYPITNWQVSFSNRPFFGFFWVKWLYEYKIRWNNLYIYSDRTNILVLESL